MAPRDSESEDSEGVDALEDFKARVQAPLERAKKAVQTTKQADTSDATFESLGICRELCRACDSMGWKAPTPIQVAAIPHALGGRDIIGLAVTGSGKTGAFTIPVLHHLLEDVKRLYCVVLAPSRELCEQIAEQFRALGAQVALEVCLVIGGIDMVHQASALAKKPHVIVASPGRLADHVENTKGFSLATVQKLVIDEADRLLSQDFDDELDKIISAMPENRQTFLFSATMTKKLSKLQKMALKDPVSVHVDDKYATAEHLDQRFLLVGQKHKWTYLAALLWHYSNRTVMVFCKTCDGAQRCAAYLKGLKFASVCLHGKMSQADRSKALQIFKTGERQELPTVNGVAGTATVLVATEVGGRGLDLPMVELVVNFDIPESSKDYIHRVGRTARAGRSGLALTFVTQYDVELFQRIELALNKKLNEFTVSCVSCAQRRCARSSRRSSSTRIRGRAANGRGSSRPSTKQPSAKGSERNGRALKVAKEFILLRLRDGGVVRAPVVGVLHVVGRVRGAAHAGNDGWIQLLGEHLHPVEPAEKPVGVYVGVVGAAEALARVHDEQLADEVLHLEPHGEREADVVVEGEVVGRHRVGGVEGRRPGQDLVHENAQRPPVGLDAVAALQKDLGREVVVRAADGVRPVAHLLREAKVHQPDVAPLVQQHVLRLQVAVHDPLGVQEVDGEHGLRGVEARDGVPQGAILVNVAEELAAADVLEEHVDVHGVLEAAHVAYYEGVPDARENVALVPQVVHLPLREHLGLVEHLQGENRADALGGGLERDEADGGVRSGADGRPDVEALQLELLRQLLAGWGHGRVQQLRRRPLASTVVSGVFFPFAYHVLGDAVALDNETRHRRGAPRRGGPSHPRTDTVL
ncbi:ATP-dependent RNA helicase [Babesia caballi]|uniref:ATP-dependent RNA helicase n=1 Tax=Babesia caballi TaxID=5871 RepID=A0AAV4M1G2_BABCB|nr:ATP-dependent RNA helicase [Babesia caballi]